MLLPIEVAGAALPDQFAGRADLADQVDQHAAAMRPRALGADAQLQRLGDPGGPVLRHRVAEMHHAGQPQREVARRHQP